MFVALLRIVGALDGAVAVVASSVAELAPSQSAHMHAVMIACGTVGTVLAAVSKFAAPPAPVAS